SVRLIDFGLANDDQRGFGTYEYMAPESFLEDQPRGPAADLYALGCLLYHMLFGAYPYAPARGAELRARHCSVQPVPIPSRDLPRALVRVLQEMLAKDQEHRYTPAGTLAEILSKLAESPRWPSVS